MTHLLLLISQTYLIVLFQTEETHIPPSNVSREALEDYRSKWTCDVPASRTMRFQTESRRATSSAPLRFQMPSLRLLPGVYISYH